MTKELEPIKIKAVNLMFLVHWLKELKLPAEETRERTKFIRVVKGSMVSTEKKRIKIIEKYAKKDKEGNYIKKKNENGIEEYDISEEDKKKIGDEINKLYETKVEIPTENNISKINKIKNILKETSYEFSGVMADQYDMWCEAFNI